MVFVCCQTKHNIKLLYSEFEIERVEEKFSGVIIDHIKLYWKPNIEYQKSAI